MKNNSVANLFPEENLTGKAEAILESLGKHGIWNLAHDGVIGCNPGYIFRGEADFLQPLQSSLERKLHGEPGNAPIEKEKLQGAEKELITKFVQGDGRRVAEIIDKQVKRKISEPPSSVFWWLSVMQHYQHPTRLIDFTKDIRFALFFAIESFETSNKSNRLSDDLIIYCLPCKDLKFESDPDNNKCPFKFSGNLPRINMHVAIGCQISLPWMHFDESFFKTHLENRNGQCWGWDRPYFQNPRLEFQKGMFVYPYDYPECALEKNGDSWLIKNLRAKSEDPFNHKTSTNDLSAKRIRISAEHIDKLKRHLKEKCQLTKATVYVDYARIEI